MGGTALATDDGRMSGMPGSDEVKPAGVKLTHDDFLLFPDDGKRHELIDGEHHVTPAPFVRHQQIVGRLHLAIGNYLAGNNIGLLLLSPMDVILTRFDVVEPDLLYVSNARAPGLLDKWVHGAPDLVVEVTSKGTRKRDETIKRDLYEREGVLEYWVINPELNVVRVYSREGERFAAPVELSREAGDTLITPLFPGLLLSLQVVLAD